jgi:type I restriction-modification system DNA methylase subunit
LETKYTDIIELINAFDYSNKDIIQELFMLFGNKLTKFKLDQFYTPLTISKFICHLMNFGETIKAIDPAGGTGDLLLYYKGHKTIWDIDSSALKLCRFNYQLNKFNDSEFHLECRNSLSHFEDSLNSFDYVTMNPPFGSSTTITERSILDKFDLGRGKKKQEIGVLFLELGLKLLKNNGIMFIVVPSGYVIPFEPLIEIAICYS